MQGFCSSVSALWAALQTVAWLEWAKATFDLLKGVSWPLAIFGLFWLFRREIRERLPHLISAGPGGAVFEPPQQQAPPAQPAVSLDPPEHPLASVNELAKEIRRTVDITIAEKREPLLVQALADARIAANFEFIFSEIFQSQIDALRELKVRPKTISEAEQYFETEVIPRNKDLFEKWGFEKWALFLAAQRLVQVVEDKIEITQKGLDFLDFVKNQKAGFVRTN